MGRTWSRHTMKTKRTVLTKLTIVGLVSVAVAIWTQWLSGDPAYPKFPPGPVIFIVVAAIVAMGTRWWWTPLIGALIALLVTSGWFALLPRGVLRLTHPGSVGKFAAGIFAGTLLQITALLFTDIAGLAATIQNYRRMEKGSDSAKVACRLFGGLFVLYVPNIANALSTGLAGAIYGVILLLVIFVMPAGAAGFVRIAAARMSRWRRVSPEGR